MTLPLPRTRGDFETPNLAYWDSTRRVICKANDTDRLDDVELGGLDDIDACPEPFRAEFRQIVGDVVAAELYGIAYRAHVEATYRGLSSFRGI